MQIKKLSLNAKMTWAVVIVSAACCGIAALGITGISAVAQSYVDIGQKSEMHQTYWMEIRHQLSSMFIAEREFVIEFQQDKSNINSEVVIAKAKSHKEKIENLLSKIEGMGSKQDTAKIESFKKNLSFWWSNSIEILKAKSKLSYQQESAAKATELIKLVNELLSASESELKAEYSRAGNLSQERRESVYYSAFLAVAASLLLSFFLIHQLRNSIDRVVKSLIENSNLVETASGQVAQSAAKLSQASTEQAASLQETAASAQEMTGMVHSNMENAKTATTLTQSSQDCAQKGQLVVKDMANAISEINLSNQNIMNQVNESNSKISEITKVIAEIGNKTKVINDIVFQTKLLSFNASVEAARAGEHGRGFSVVAEEVGNLARMSGVAAKEITEMLDSSLSKVDSIVRETKSNVERLVIIGKEKVEAGQQVVEACGGVLDEIVGSVGQVSRMSTDISAASQEQAQGIGEISRAVTQLDSVTQLNAAAAEQAATAAEQLSDQARSLKSSIVGLIGIVSGSDASAAFGCEIESSVDKKKFSIKENVTKVFEKFSRSSNSDSGFNKYIVRAMDEQNRSGNLSCQSYSVGEVKKSEVSNLRSMKNQKPEGAINNSIKLASGGDVEIPTEDDPRFKDV